MDNANEAGAGQTASGQGQYGENGRPITDYCAKYDLS